MQAYGYNRYRLELWAREKYPDALIIRLPGLFGKNIKKNFIYDFINVIPFMLKKDKFAELLNQDPELEKYYIYQTNGFYKVNVSDEDKNKLKKKFELLGFSALNFTDSRSVFQFYNLKRLWNDIEIALDNGLRLWHPATEPVSASEIYEYLTGRTFIDEIQQTPVFYDYRTVYSEMFGGKKGYICYKEHVLEEIEEFVNSNNSSKSE